MRYHEDSIQVAILVYLRRVMPAGWIVFHCPNGGHRDPRVAARMKWLGTLAGVPDLILVGPEGRVGFLEIKASKGRLSPPQKAFAEYCERNDVPHTVAQSIDDARDFLSQLNIETREVS